MSLDFHDAQGVAEELTRRDDARNAEFIEYDTIGDMDWEPEGMQSWMQPMVSPDPYNAEIGAENILCTTAPAISIPYETTDDEKADEEAQAQNDKVETALRLILTAASRARGEPLERSAVHNAARYGLVAFKCALTADIAESKALTPQKRRRYAALAERMPVLIDVPEPATIHEARTILGLEAVVECSQRTAREIRAQYGDEAPGTGDHQASARLDLFHYWDTDVNFSWVGGCGTPLIEQENKLGFIPYVVERTGNSLLFAIHRGSIWKRQNLALTAIASSALTTAFPAMVYETDDPDTAEALDFTAPGQVYPIRRGDKVYPGIPPARNAALSEFYQITSGLHEQSTLSHTVLGIAPQNISAYAALNLLVQGARGPLARITVGVGWAMSELCELILRYVKARGVTIKLYGNGRDAELRPSDIRDGYIEVKVELKPDYPQDRLQLANVAMMLTKAQLMSRKRAMELTGADSPAQESEQIKREAFEDVHMQQALKEVASEPLPREDFEDASAPDEPMMGAQMQPQMQPPAPPSEQMLPPGMTPQMLGVPPEAQMQAAARGGGPAPEEMM